MANGEQTLFSISSDPNGNTVQVKVAEPVLEAMEDKARNWASSCRRGSCRSGAASR